ncbi:LOW QUALITY PROTEIN: death-inducer obliterator 1 [Drosophila eugracilis]|uniref:LOW QUALITY PROTEIN: death-inducer obliterator 1 n=1 Tax=Drosophila eugracilis TaxID=29029 RepID=UPI001BD99ED8|nr:LOW QUALITY PROTEIN: death-inducer obliterator 1 [Drosophila eugracilis]
MSSSVFTEAPSARPAAADADSNLVVVYSKNGVSFDERAIGNLMEEKSISTISVVRLTSPTPSMMDQEEAERLEELANFMDTATDSELDSDNGSQSDGEDASDADAQDEENQNTGEENNGDSTDTETDTPRTRRRPGRKPKIIKKRKRRRPKERPQIVGLRVEQFYADSTADMVVKNALKLAGVSIYKRTAETDALMEVIRNDHNYTPFTSPEQLKNHKRAEKMDMEAQSQSRKIIMQAPGSIKLINAKKRVQAIPFSPLQVKVQRLPVKPHQVQQPVQLQSKVQLIRKPIHSPLPRQKPEIIASNMVNVRPRPSRAPIKVIAPVHDHIEDDDDAQSSDPADEDNADKSYDTEEMSEESDDFQESDNDRDSDMDFDMRHSGGRNKRKRVKKVVRHSKPSKPLPMPPSTTQHFPDLKKRKEIVEQKAPQIGQIIQLPTKAAPTVIALGRGLPSTSFLKTRPSHKTLPVKKPPLPATPSNPNVRRVPSVHLGRIINSPQDVKEIIINKNMASPKGVFTNLNSLLGENNNATIKSSPDSLRHRAVMSPSTPKSSYTQHLPPIVVPVPAQAPTPSKGFMPIGVDTAQSHKLPAQIVIETHQSSSELAAENDKQLDLINSIVQDELMKTTLVDQPTVNADEDIPKLVKMLESTAADLGPAPVSFPTQNLVPSDLPGVENPSVVDIDIMAAADEDEITADFLQHVVGLIEEDKQFEAEVVKQVLASTEPGTLDAIASLPMAVHPVVLPQALTIQAQANLAPPAVVAESAQSMTSLPIACSTPSRSLATPLPTSAKVVRGNGRVIYLPPIEAPTTRAKRRAQFPASSDIASASSGDLGNLSFGESTLDTSINQLANSSSLSNDSQSGIGPKRPNPREPSLARRSTVPRRSKKLNTSQNNDPDASESQEDDDDPNKLWCICRQPHNNRFMICCDLCEDWFHGTCVGVTKAMGTEMENKGVDWKCPKCVKKQEEKNQPRITEMLVSRTSALTEEKPNETKVITSSAELVQLTSPLAPKRTLPVGVTVSSSPIRIPMIKPAKKFPTSSTPYQQQQLNFIKLGPSSGNRISDTACVVCKRPANSNSVYCSEECIRKYAQNAIHSHTATKGPDSPLPHNAGIQSPLNNSLEAKKFKKKDLFEDVLRQADSVSKVERINVFERRTGRVITGHLAPPAHQFKKWLQENPTFEVLPLGTIHSIDTEKRQLKRAPEASSVSESITQIPAKKPLDAVTKASQPTAIQVSPLVNSSMRPLLKKDKEKEKPSPAAQTAAPSRSAGKPEPVRIGIRRSLREQLLARIKEAQAVEQTSSNTTTQWLTVFEVDQFVKNVELEMFNSFGRDVGAKYKAKYRSLMFNIKDRKNRTLFEKICAKQVEPKQLVRMTPEELASQELAKWREEENRHQLDMIKKSELDMLSCAQNYVVKTHKGEDVIPTKVDVKLPEEDNSSTVDTKQTSFVNEPEVSVLERSTSREKSSSSKEKRHKTHKHHHRKRSRSRSNSRGRNLEKRHRRHHNEEDSGGRDREHRSREKQSRERDEVVPSPLPKKREENDQSPVPKKIVEKKADQSAYNLIDQILESEKTVEQAANLGKPKPSPKPLPTLPSLRATEPMDNYSRYVQGLTTKSLWTGTLKMIDVTDFDMVMHPVQGNCHQLGNLMPSQMDVIGRITRVNVWEYIKKLKKSPTKEVVIVNIFPASPSETVKFDLFFDYLDSRQRLGVMGVDSDQIRDFYIFPLGAEDQLPPALQTVEQIPFYEDTQRPNTLLGIIVRCLTKRPIDSLPTTPSVPSPVPTANSKMAKKSRSTAMFMPQGSPKRKASTHSTSSKDDEFDIDAIIKAPIAKLQKTLPKPAPLPPVLNDADEPYSPGGSDDELVPIASRIPNDLERQVNEINKQIAAQQMEIAGLLKVEPSGSSSSSNVLAGISIPPNLSKILASIKDKPEQCSKTGEDSEEYNPEEAITSSFAAKPKSKGRLAHLSEAELLSMVPDNLAAVIPSSSKTRHQHHPPPLPPPPPPPPGV